jgi:serine/threonine-protein kinase HipA
MEEDGFDLLNSSIMLSHPAEEFALSLNGKKRNLTKKDFLSYFAIERLGLNQNIITKVVEDITQALPVLYDLIKKSFLPIGLQEEYRRMVEDRSAKLLHT